MYQLVSIPRFTLLDAGALGLSGKMGYPAHVAPVLSPLTEMFWCVCVCVCTLGLSCCARLHHSGVYVGIFGYSFHTYMLLL